MAGRLEEWAPKGVDSTVPNMARIYDYFLGGEINYAVDRIMAEEMQRRVPEARDTARANRRFLGRAVAFLAEAGIRQFLDLGAGLPSRDNVHEVAQRVCPDARVVYVDNDPIVLAHAQALLAAGDSTAFIHEDMRDSRRILGHPIVEQMIDFSQPVAVLFVSVLHFVGIDKQAQDIVSTLTERLVPGSYLAVSHGTFESHPDDELTVHMEEKMRRTSASAVFRSRDAIARFFTGFDLVEPGLVYLTDWRPDDLERSRDAGQWMLGGVGRKP